MSTTSKRFTPRQEVRKTEQIRSTVMFQGDFKKALQGAIDVVDATRAEVERMVLGEVCDFS